MTETEHPEDDSDVTTYATEEEVNQDPNHIPLETSSDDYKTEGGE